MADEGYHAVSYIDLSVDQNQLIVDVSVRFATEHTFVNYQATFPSVDVRLQHRLGTTGEWSNISLATVMLDAQGNLPRDYRQAGRFPTPELRPGDVYQVRALLVGNDSDVQGIETVLVSPGPLADRDRLAHTSRTLYDIDYA